MNTENVSTLKIHKLTKAQYERELGAGRIDPTAIYLTPNEELLSIEQGGTGASNAADALVNLGAAPVEHLDDTNNPHGVTALQVGLGNVDNTSDMDKPVSTAQAAAIADAKKAGTDAQGAIDTHVADKNNPHGVTIEQIGAAPSGYGLGESGTSVTDLNTALNCGFIAWSGDCANAPFSYGMGIVLNRYNGRYTQLLFNPHMGSSGIGQIVVRHYDGTNWLPDEWVNPPMVAGVEYRTTERSGGKVVYKKLQDGVIHYRLDGETDWKLYSGIVGAAPSGYGYGGQSVALKNNSLIADEDDLDNELAKIYDAMNAGETKMITFFGYPSNSDWRFFGILTKSSANNGSLVAQSAYNSGTEIIKTKYNGTWQPCEWKNPPMHRNVEYRTTERWDGKAVYTQNYYYGYYDSSVTSIEHGISGITNCISIEVINNSYGTFANTNEISLSFTPTTIGITSPWSMGGAFFILKYVK